MALRYALGQARASSASNPITFSYTVNTGDRVVVLLLKVNGATDRAGGAPTWGSATFTQANATQKAAASPEASCEIWYLLNPEPGTQTLTIPNTGALTIFYTVGLGQDPNNKRVAFDSANGGNATSSNPTPGAVTTGDDGALLFAITAGGWQTWNPSAQAGTAINNNDDGAHGEGSQYLEQAVHASVTLNWTFGTSDDWGAVVAAFTPLPSNVIDNYKRVGASVG
jgi:hypothetical protein